jgi:hypothetical protein
VTTTQSSTQSVQLRSAIAWTAGVAAIWILAAVLRPETTLHLGPVFLPLIPAFLLKGDERALVGVVAGIALGAATITLLSLTGNLDGPPIEPFTSTLTESYVVLAVSGILGLIFSKVTQKT